MCWFQIWNCEFQMQLTNWRQNMCSNGTYLILFMHHNILKSSNLIKIVAKALAMSLTCILEIYLGFKKRKRCKLNHFRFWKIKKGFKRGNGWVKTLGLWGKASKLG